MSDFPSANSSAISRASKNVDPGSGYCSALLAVSLLLLLSFFSPTQSLANQLVTNSIENPESNESNIRPQLVDAFLARGSDYQARAEHRETDGTPVYFNRLIREDSPYLLQHAHNPVNWYPWGEEAFALARRENKPVFLSIGYATCHWCHVMERESFEDLEVAKLLNQNYIAIKVDREQLPDVDAIYMTAVQILTGRGGWPMSVFLQADGKPFHGGTYFPKKTFIEMLTQVSRLWVEDSAQVAAVADRLSDAVEQRSQLRGIAREVGEQEFGKAREAFLSSFDSLQGGFDFAPKFPREATLLYLLELAQRNGDKEALDAAIFSLQRMAAGGIQDHVGGGFHRYAIDNEWLVPHFEKMLYNQAALARVYLQAYQLTGNHEHQRTARRLLDYVQREMTSDGGGFFSATDADSEGEEGMFFVWTLKELQEVLGADATLASEIWSVTEQGNFKASNILHLQDTLAETALEHDMSTAQLTQLIDGYSARLLAARSKRQAPLRDNKIISEWNGMMIAAFAMASEILTEPGYLKTAQDAADFIWRHNRRESGLFWRARFNGKSSVEATQADYAYLAFALLTLHDVTNDPLWLERSLELVNKMHELFWDQKSGGYFIGSQVVAGAALPTRPKSIYDNSTPSGNAVALQVLTRLWLRTGDVLYKDRADALLAAFSPYLSSDASAFAYMLVSASELLGGESGHRQYAARGRVKVEAKAVGENLKLMITMAPGWHINAAQPLQDYLVGTRLTAAKDALLADVVYPQPVRRVLGFQRSELALLEGQVEIQARLSNRLEKKPFETVKLLLQACDNKVCLAPETITLNFAIESID